MKRNPRAIPKAYVILLAKQGLTPKQIVEKLGVVDGAPFHVASVTAVLGRARKTDSAIPRFK